MMDWNAGEGGVWGIWRWLVGVGVSLVALMSVVFTKHLEVRFTNLSIVTQKALEFVRDGVSTYVC